jgi:hypothetical protein
MRERTIALLAQHRVPELAQLRETRRAELQRCEEELAAAEHRVSLWQRAAFFYQSPDEAEVAERKKRAESARQAFDGAVAEADEAVKRVWAECPPAEIAHRVELIIASTLADPGVARTHGLGSGPLASELGALAERVLAVWAPNVDTRALAAALADDTMRSANALRQTTTPREDAVLGWEAVGHDELLARAAASLEASGFAQARAAIAKNAAEHATLARQLEEARRAVSFIDRVMPGESPAEARVRSFEQGLNHEQQELVAATESAKLAVDRALAVHPPLAIHAAALAALGVLLTATPRLEAAIEPHSGALAHRPSAHVRAFVLAALVELRRSLERAFPGLSELVSGRGGARDARELDRARAAARGAVVGPYRREGASEDDQPPEPRSYESEAAFLDDLERWQLRASVGRALVHAGMIARARTMITQTEEDNSFFERLVFWRESEPQKRQEELEASARWHSSLLDAMGFDAVGRVAQAGSYQPLLAFHALLVAAQGAVRAITTYSGSSSTSKSCPTLGKEEAMAAVDRLVAHLAACYGMRGDRDQLIADVAQRLRSPARAAAFPRGRALDHAALVDGLAEVLRPTELLTLVDRVAHARQRYDQSSHASQAAASQVTFWDTVNVFSDSDAERLRDHYSAEAVALWASLHTDIARVNQLVDAALPNYPPADAYYALLRVRAIVGVVHAVQRSTTTTHRSGNSTYTTTRYYCELVGRNEALRALERWTMIAVRVFGTVPSASELLERWVAREL